MVLLKLKAREEQGKEKNKVHLVTCNHHKVMCDSTMKSANQDLTPSAGKPAETFETGIRKTVAWYLNGLNKENG